MNLVTKLLRKNLSTAQLAGFILSNFIGLVIVTAGLQLFLDIRTIWNDEDSFIKKDYLIVNKTVTSANTMGGAAAQFTPSEIRQLREQPWVRSVGEFANLDYRISASIEQNGRGMSTFMFFESLPDEYVDVAKSQWTYAPGSPQVPIIISKDYLTLYNFGFATSAGLPQLSEKLMSSIPMSLTIYPANGSPSVAMQGRIVGFSNRLNTILVPQSFMEWSNRRFGNPQESAKNPARLIVDVSDPGSPAINSYLAEHNLETAGDKKSSQASYLLNVITTIVLAVGVVITLLSFFILMLSISLLMQKNREKLHELLMLGYPLKTVGAPYTRLIIWASLSAMLLAIVGMLIARLCWLPMLENVGGGNGAIWVAPLVALGITMLTVLFNVLSVRRKVAAAWRL